MIAASLVSLTVAATQLVGSNPFDDSGALRGTLTATTYHHGRCYGVSSLAGGAYTCSFAHYVADPCWKDPRKAARFVCRYSPFTKQVSVVEVDETPDPPDQPADHSSWALRLANGHRCVARRGATDRVGSLSVNFVCDGTLRLLGDIDRTRPRWRIRTANYHRARGYTRGPWRNIAASYYVRP